MRTRSEGGPVSAPSFDAVLPEGWTEGDDSDVENATALGDPGRAQRLWGFPRTQREPGGPRPSGSGLESEERHFRGRTSTSWPRRSRRASTTTSTGWRHPSGPSARSRGSTTSRDLDPTRESMERRPSRSSNRAAPSGQRTFRFRAVALVHDGLGFNITASGSRRTSSTKRPRSSTRSSRAGSGRTRAQARPSAPRRCGPSPARSARAPRLRGPRGPARPDRARR